MSYRLTVRHGSNVDRERFENLDSAVAAMERLADEVRSQGTLETVKMLREFEPSERVAARLEISTGGTFRGASAGVDVMGDSSVVAFAGGVRRRTLQPRDGETPFDAVRRELSD